ncbi:hypothetical protein, partial [Escherichia coli]|uniref:hypothetical protein n=1 Tax=Escherichia coli TaxID=562 RepID=UPI001BDBEB8B
TFHPMPPKVSERDWFLAHAVRRGKYCPECGVKKWQPGIYCATCFDLLPESIQRGLRHKDLWIAAYVGAKNYFFKHPAPKRPR